MPRKPEWHLRCYFTRGMRVRRWILAVICTAAFCGGRALYDLSAAVSDGAASKPTATMKFLRVTAAEVTREPDHRNPRLDMYGNPIDPAVGDYRVDWHGDMYEWHAPDTAVLKLPSPGV